MRSGEVRAFEAHLAVLRCGERAGREDTDPLPFLQSGLQSGLRLEVHFAVRHVFPICPYGAVGCLLFAW